MMRSGSGISTVSSACSNVAWSIASRQQLAAADTLGERARRAHDLVARAVVEGDSEVEPAIARRDASASSIRPRISSGTRLALADDADLHAVAVELGEVAADEDAHEVEQTLDLLVGARPVLRGEAEQRQVADAAAHREADRAAQRFDAAAMALAARHAVRVRPAAVAVHDDGDMTRQTAPGRPPASPAARALPRRCRRATIEERLNSGI